MTCEAWPLIWTCDPPEGTDERIGQATDLARQMLWSRTGRRFGSCSVVEDYRATALGQCGFPQPGDNGVWLYESLVVLERQPVNAITSVTVNGVVVNPSGYRLAGAALHRVGEAWPGNGTAIRVAYSYGVPLDVTSPWHTIAGLAMGEVAFEVFTALCGNPCKLPARAVSITRQGVTVQLGDATEFMRDGLLGLPFADQFITAANPGRRPARSKVYSPDIARPSLVTAP